MVTYEIIRLSEWAGQCIAHWLTNHWPWSAYMSLYTAHNYICLYTSNKLKHMTWICSHTKEGNTLICNQWYQQMVKLNCILQPFNVNRRTVFFRLKLKCDGTRWRKEGKWRRSWRMQWVASTLHTTSEHGVSSITTADAHTSAVPVVDWTDAHRPI